MRCCRNSTGSRREGARAEIGGNCLEKWPGRAVGLTHFRTRPIILAMRRKSPLAGALLGLLLGLALGGSALADGCGCGGPKSYYAKKYGTVKPPQFNLLIGTTTPAPAPAPAPESSETPAGGATAAPVNPPATGTGG